ncbi:MAG TPA: hypothetical protein VEU78_06770 [Steroidobacteraceae bacterium]|nr:hypothetical protein [Steroidobacteraceae bacterium]
MSYRSAHGGALYGNSQGPLKGLILPYSFGDSDRYWGEYVCRLSNTECAVSDVYDPGDYSVRPAPGPGAPLQDERVNVHNGTNIYDAATWQIATMLGAVVNRFGNSLDAEPYRLVSNQNAVLSGAYVAPDMPLGSRATTKQGLYVYNGVAITDARAAYAFRMTAVAWLADDPLKDSQFAQLLRAGALPANRPQYQPGRISWSDWKPVTGDNAWAFFVGPLHAAYLHYVLAGHGAYVPFRDQSIQNALAVLPTFAAMQSPLGAIYYAPSGTLGNSSDRPVNAYSVSVENNLSVYAGLRILDATLAAELAHESGLETASRDRIEAARRIIAAMISGGRQHEMRSTQGLLAFLRGSAWQEGEFVRAGYANERGTGQEWRAVTEPKAVDVDTWGVAALGPGRIDGWFGFGASYEVWQRLKRWGGYGVDRTLWGVGYSDADGNGQTADGAFRSGVLSAEWTAGAIVMVRSMLRHYGATPRGESRAYARAREFVRQLRADETAMIRGIQELRFGRYVAGSMPGKPANYGSLLAEPTGPLATQPYLYASSRYLIPFGWYANPLPSTCATAWILLVADDYDPFVYGGGLAH